MKAMSVKALLATVTRQAIALLSKAKSYLLLRVASYRAQPDTDFDGNKFVTVWQ